jgi:hypothetical protein
MAVFFSLQALDVLTTLIGLRLGAGEGSFFVARLIHLGPLTGLLLAKCFALILLAAAIGFKRPRVIVFLNYWFTAIITWNLVTILRSAMAR